MLMVRALADQLEQLAETMGMSTDDVLAALLFEMPDLHLMGLTAVESVTDFPVADELAAVMDDMAPDLGLTTLGLTYAMVQVITRVRNMAAAVPEPEPEPAS